MNIISSDSGYDNIKPKSTDGKPIIKPLLNQGHKTYDTLFNRQRAAHLKPLVNKSSPLTSHDMFIKFAQKSIDAKS